MATATKKKTSAKTAAKKSGGAKKSSGARNSTATTAKRKSGGRGMQPKGMKTKARSTATSRAAKSSAGSKASARKTSSGKPARKTTAKKAASTKGNVTIDHDEIREWVEARNGKPSTVVGTERGRQDAGLLRIDFPGYSGKDSLSPVDWDEFFEKFDDSNLAFLHATGKRSRFNKFIAREGSPRKKSRSK